MNKKKDDKAFNLPVGAEVNIIPIMSGEVPGKVDETNLPTILPVLALRNAVLFPGTVYPVTIGRKKSLRLVDEAFEKNLLIAAFPQLNVTEEEPRTEKEFSEFGTLAKVLKTIEMPDGTITAIIIVAAVIRTAPLTAYLPAVLEAISIHENIELTDVITLNA